MLTLNQNDYRVLQQHGLSISQVETQLQRLRQGVQPLHLARPCGIGDGIIQFSPQHRIKYHRQFQNAYAAGRVSKFIPASGAATRLFKDLLQCLDTTDSSLATSIQDCMPPENIVHAWEQLFRFPFIEHLRQYFKAKKIDFQQLYDTNQLPQVFRALLHTPGLDYANFPKALLPFHHYPEGPRTSLEEHVREAMLYSPKASCPIRIHLTVSAQFEKPVKAALDMIQQQEVREEMAFELTVSIQKPSTDTIALDSEDQPFRNNEGALVFRPGGHGALLENLNDYQGDIVCISNIDNVVPDHLKGPIVEWRMALGGYLVALQQEVFHHLQQLHSANPTVIDEAEHFVRHHLLHQFPAPFNDLDMTGKAAQLIHILHRPIRVCGVVPNTGDPGGGPFWVQHADGSQSRQIVEQSQVNPESHSQHELFALATHFNPVDMVCGMRDFQGNPFNLLNFTDPETSFIAHKSYEGRPLKALEWPGLWNGGMADWITLFVEIPRSTFNPVKTFLDWLQPTHQPPN